MSTQKTTAESVQKVNTIDMKSLVTREQSIISVLSDAQYKKFKAIVAKHDEHKNTLAMQYIISNIIYHEYKEKKVTEPHEFDADVLKDFDRMYCRNYKKQIAKKLECALNEVLVEAHLTASEIQEYYIESLYLTLKK